MNDSNIVCVLNYYTMNSSPSCLVQFLLEDLKDMLESFSSLHTFQGVGSKKLATTYVYPMHHGNMHILYMPGPPTSRHCTCDPIPCT